MTDHLVLCLRMVCNWYTNFLILHAVHFNLYYIFVTPSDMQMPGTYSILGPTILFAGEFGKVEDDWHAVSSKLVPPWKDREPEWRERNFRRKNKERKDNRKAAKWLTALTDQITVSTNLNVISTLLSSCWYWKTINVLVYLLENQLCVKLDMKTILRSPSQHNILGIHPSCIKHYHCL